ncbi:MAG: PAS domain S-box protein [Nitrospirae bacterium]|nr:PAS domain S-box protein [Nitrospirota bacterium]
MRDEDKTKEQLIMELEDLRMRLTRYEESQRIAHIGNWEFDIEHDNIYWSDEMFNIYGIDKQSNISYAQLMDRIYPDDRDYHNKITASWIENRRGAPFEYRIIRRNGEIRYIYVSGDVQCNEAGKPIKLFGVVIDITQLKHMEQKLTGVTQRLELATRSANLGIWDWDVTNNIMTWDDQMLTLYGLTWETFPGGVEAWQNGLHPDDRETIVEECKAALRGEKEWDTEFRVLHPNGTVKHIKANGMVIRDHEGTPVRMLGTNYDITERKLKEKREQYRSYTMLSTLIDNVPDLAWIKDREGRFIIVNKAVSQAANVPVDKMAGKTDLDVWPRELAEKYRSDDQAIMAAGMRKHIEESFVDAEGRLHFIETIKTPMKDENGLIIGTVGIAHNITERKRMEKELRTEINARCMAEKRMSLLLEATFEGVSIAENGRIIDCNKRLAEMYGYDPGEILGMLVLDTVTPQYREIIMKNVSEGYDKPYELDCLKKDGTVINVEVCGKSLEHEGRKIRMAAIRDITQRKRMEKELKTLNEHLMAQVATGIEKIRTHEQMLIQQSKMAAMGEMIGLIAHQWKQPINAVGLSIQDLRDAYTYGEVDDKYIDNLIGSTMQQISFMAKTIDDFRNFFMPSKNKVTFNVKTTIEELLLMFTHIFIRSKIGISMKAEQDAILVTDGYPNEFKQVVLNILNNSKDAILSRKQNVPEIQGNIEINISNDEDKSKIIVSIKDNGGGIPEDIIEKIFEPYFTTKENEGTGVGLYMSKTIIETNMGGKLSVRNVDDCAEFLITLNATIVL